MQSELKPCPFCGGEASIGHVAFSRPLAHIEWEDGTPVTEAFYGHCKNCNASTRNGFHGGQRNEAEAITAWNARASDAEITRLTEALRAAEKREKALREAVERLRSGYADAVSGYSYILTQHGRLEGVGFDRVMDHYHDWVAMPEREGLLAGSHTLAGAKP